MKVEWLINDHRIVEKDGMEVSTSVNVRMHSKVNTRGMLEDYVLLICVTYEGLKRKGQRFGDFVGVLISSVSDNLEVPFRFQTGGVR